MTDSLATRVRDEINKLHRPVASGPGTPLRGPDWSQVLALCNQALASEPSDLRMMVYATAATFHAEDVASLEHSLKRLLALVAERWDTLAPEVARARLRASILAWLVDHLLAQTPSEVRSSDPAEWAAAWTRCAEAATQVGVTLAERLGDSQGFERLARTWRDVGAAAPIATASAPNRSGGDVSPSAPAAVGSGPALAAGASLKASAEVLVDPVSADDARRQLRTIAERLSGLAAYHQGVRLSDPTAFRLRRMGEWAEVAEVPPVGAGRRDDDGDGDGEGGGATSAEGRTDVAFPADVAARVKALFADGNDEAFIRTAEKYLSGDAIFWLDMQHMVARALERMGDAYREARLAVEHEMLVVTLRLPGIELRRFDDGTPFADEGTRAWLAALKGAIAGNRRHLVPLDGKGGKGGAGAALSAVPGPGAQADEGQVERLSEGLASGPASPQEQFFRELVEAEGLLDAGETFLASALLQELEKDLREVPVAKWEKAIYSRVLQRLLECHQRLGPASSQALPSPETYLGRLVRTDREAALRFKWRP